MSRATSEKPLTAAKVRAVLRKAGHVSAKWEPSGMIRGWGEYSDGYKVETDPAGEHRVSHEGSHRTPVEEHKAAIRDYLKALRAGGIDAEIQDTFFGEAVVCRGYLPSA